MNDPAVPKAKKLHIVAARTPRYGAPARAGVKLSGIFAQLVELQALFGTQMVSIEEGIQQQRQELVTTMGQLPEIREKLNWLIASFHEQGKQDATLRARVDRHETAIRSLCESQARWNAVMEQLAVALAQSKSIPAR